ncbi:MAG: A24 family peptidase [Gammaproteobacteria bacterium]|nr:A24 family peptidase [Gammaproteobacteria bacterium]
MLEVFDQHPALLLGSTFVFGLLIGSFLNVIIYRLPIMMEREYKREFYQYFNQQPSATDQQLLDETFNLTLPHSHCPKCNARVKPWQNLPLISYIWLKGKCGYCRETIPKCYPMVELITGLFSVIVVWQLGFSWQALAGCGFTWALVALSAIDFDRQLLPDSITLPLLWAGLLVNSWQLFTSIQDAVIGAIVGYLSLWIVFHMFKLITGKEGMGAGDFKLLAAIGAWFGWQMLPLVILLAAGAGAIAGLSWMLIVGRDKNLPIAFGPYLAAAGWIAMLWGQPINNWYLNYSGLS